MSTNQSNPAGKRTSRLAYPIFHQENCLRTGTSWYRIANLSSLSPGNGAANAHLNPQRRPQRLFGKVRAAMNAVDKKLQQSTRIPVFLSESNFEQFRTNIREFLRLE